MTKTEMAQNAFRTGDVKTALRIAKTFKIGLEKAEQKQITLAYECMVHPDFYQQIGKKPAEEISRGVDIFVSHLIF